MTRAAQLAEAAASRELDAVLVSEAVNLRYLTGFTGTNGLAVVGAGDGVRAFVTDFRYVERAEQEVEGFDRLTGERDLLDSVAGALPAARPLRLGFDDEHVSVRAHARLGEALGDGVHLQPAGGMVESLREVKEAGERRAIAAAAGLADTALRAALERGLAGRTERDFARDLENEIRRAGAEGPSFPSIVAAGAHGALPHAEPRDAEIPPGTLVVVDWGARVDGYCSDCTRTFATGELDPQAAEIYALVQRAQRVGLDAVRAGRTGREVDAAARDLIAEAGHGERCGHGLGHGVGLEVHEGPRLSKAGSDRLRAGSVVTVEPGVYLPGRFGVRIEDLVVVGEEGPEILSSLSKELTVVG